MKMEFAVRGGGISGVAPQQRSARRYAATASGSSHPLVAWLVLIGLIIPAAEVQFYIAGAKFTVGRIGIVLLLVPAVLRLFSNGRRLMLPDLLVLATATWMVGAALYIDGMSALSSAGAEALELLGGYLVARAYFFGPAALKTFLAVLKVLAFIAILFAVADRISGRLMIHDFFGSLMHVRPIDAQDRMGVLRAASTFDHAILFGLFCAVVGAMLLYSESNTLRRFVWTGVCFFGGYLSLSSSSVMAFAILFGAYAYDRLMKQYPWRWSACWTACGIFALTIMLVAKHPLGWILSHLTLDPASGYFRLLEWGAATDQISQSPWTGYAFLQFGTPELYSVDSVWLCMALRYGLPMIALLFLANLAVLLPNKRAGETGDIFMDRMRTALSVVLVIYVFVGLTAHFWNYMWIFWGTCLGIATSLQEYSLTAIDRSVVYSRPALVEARNERAPALVVDREETAS